MHSCTPFFIFLLLFSKVALAVEEVNFNEKAWKQVSYKKIPPNVVEFSQDFITVTVNASASPLVYQLPEPYKIKKIRIVAEISGIDLNQIKDNKKLLEDSPIRVGLVLDGTKKLNFIQSRLAADWVIELFKLAPKNQGLSHIQFYNVGWFKTSKDISRTHPNSDLIKETWTISIEAVTADKQIYKLQSEFLIPESLHDRITHALWISIDGDDLKIKYKTIIRKISYE